MRRTILGVQAALLSLAACAEPSTSPAAKPTARAIAAARQPVSSASVYWNAVSRDLVVKHKFNPFQALRGYALVSAAQYHAALAVRPDEESRGRPSMRAAIGSASVTALTYLFPDEAAALGSMLQAQIDAAAAPDGDTQAGIAIGKTEGDAAVAHTAADNFFAPWSGTVPVGPGLWFSSAIPPQPPYGVLFGQATPYFLNSGDQFRPPPPPVFGSPEFLAGLAEVRHIADTRTAEQDSIAKFWAFPVGTYSPSGYWNDQAAQLVVAYHLRDREAAHVFAVMNMIGFDAVIASHDAKYAYWSIRPFQADPGIKLAIALPNFPSYPSNHASVSSAMTTALGSFFPAERARLRAMAEQAAMSRLFGGIHFRVDDDTGLRLGRRVAAWGLCHDRGGEREDACDDDRDGDEGHE